jgi:hypothetical protein
MANESSGEQLCIPTTGKRPVVSSLYIFGGHSMPRKSIREVLKSHTDELMAVPGVMGVAEGESQGRPCIRVFVVDKNSDFLRELPDTIDGYRLLVVESGNFQALSN